MSKLQRSRRTTTITLFFLALAVSVALFGALYSQMAQGGDPVLGSTVNKEVIVVNNQQSAADKSQSWSSGQNTQVPEPAAVVSTPS